MSRKGPGRDYIQHNNAVYDAYFLCLWSEMEKNVFHWIVRNSWGFKSKDRARVPLAELADLFDRDKTTISRILSKLLKNKAIIRYSKPAGRGRPGVYGPNKYTQQWRYKFRGNLRPIYPSGIYGKRLRPRCNLFKPTEKIKVALLDATFLCLKCNLFLQRAPVVTGLALGVKTLKDTIYRSLEELRMQKESQTDEENEQQDWAFKFYFAISKIYYPIEPGPYTKRHSCLILVQKYWHEKEKLSKAFAYALSVQRKRDKEKGKAGYPWWCINETARVLESNGVEALEVGVASEH